MAYCTACGARLPGDARFCPACGARVVADAPPPARGSSPAPGARGRGGWLLGALALLAVVVLVIVFVQQRDGARPVAEQANVQDDPAPAPSPSDVATPAPTVAPVPDNGDAGIIGEPTAPDRELPPGEPVAGEPVTVRGIVAEAELPVPGVAVALEGRTRSDPIVARFPDDEGDAVALLRPGMEVRLRCADMREVSGTTLLEGCRL